MSVYRQSRLEKIQRERKMNVAKERGSRERERERPMKYENICYIDRVAARSLDDTKHMPGVGTVKYPTVPL